jgi:predicted AlkP superfamily pyrophosphatase or phosphodiesterase
MSNLNRISHAKSQRRSRTFPFAVLPALRDEVDFLPFLFLLFQFFLAPPSVNAQDATRPQLVVLIAVDQMRSEYFDRFRGDFVGGFARMLTSGIFFENATLNYAVSETAPGHASLSSARYPSQNGIIANEWYDTNLKRRIYCVEDSTALAVEGEGGFRSSKNLVGTSLGDWLKQASPGSRVISISDKDRAAILLGGKNPNAAFWYDKSTGHMVSSSYYVAQLPDWAKAFNAADWVRKFLPMTWNKLQPDSLYPGADEFEGELVWEGVSTTFPHFFAPNKRKDAILTSPFADQMVLDFAREAVKAERLGQRTETDLLCLGLSATDYIGHGFGPNSHEMRDNLLRLDLALGSFLADLESIVGRGKILVAIGSDHAVMPLPEYLSRILFKPSRRVNWKSTVGTVIDSLNAAWKKRYRLTTDVVQQEGFINYAAAAKAGLPSAKLESNLRTALLGTGLVIDLFFKHELEGKRTKDRLYLQQYRNSYYAPRGRDFQILSKEFTLYTSGKTGTSHGSAYDYDTHVPVLFWGRKFTTTRSETPVHTIDVAPTIATLLGIPIPKAVDGVPIKEVLE